MQQTLKASIHCNGVGLHSGARTTLRLHPADVDCGIRFRRNGATILARHDHVVATRMCTTVGDGNGVSIGTVEHLMAALAGCGIDNAIIEIDGPEVPVMDGSAEPFVFLIDCAGVVSQSAARRYLQVLTTVSIEDGERSISIRPGEGLTIGCNIDFADEAVGKQSISIGVDADSFKSEIMRARTFGFEHEIEALRAAGLARGGSLDNAVVISGGKVLNVEGLRYEDECVRHKVLDTLGDLYLAGGPILGRVDCRRAGHELHLRLVSQLLARPGATRWVTAEEALAMPACPRAEVGRRLSVAAG
jgi:UDP-3-O-[3-hydroxymyristoyl] N-acetylglucosamine deacetylase